MKFSNEIPSCPLCDQRSSSLFFEDSRRKYFRCRFCRLVFVPRIYWLSAEDEQAVYDLHENFAQHQGYRKFLSRLADPLLDRLGPNQVGLDFGCGPGPVLSSILTAHGHHVDLYDPLYYNDPGVFNKRYDFICATEVIEHLRSPHKEFNSLFKMLKPNGWLAIMTKLVISRQAFGQWHYIRDPTHICFFSRDTLKYLAKRFHATMQCIANDVILYKKMDRV